MSFRHDSRLRALKIGVSAGAVAMALGAGSAMAQEAGGGTESSEVEAVVVTGFRNSLAKALNVKREEAAATDSILAEDIGKFPDLNLSESIQRIPGVALARDGGEGRQISVRGLGPTFTRVRINGMEALTTAGGADASGGTNRGRSFDFNIFASDLFNAITVRKTAEATTEEGSLGATVDLRTARPFDYNGFAMSASAQASFNDLSEKTAPRGAFMISNTWKDGMFGALFSVAYTKRKTVEEGNSTVRWATGNAFAPGFDACNRLSTDTASPNYTAPDTTRCGTNATLPALANPNASAVANNAAFHPRFPRLDRFENDQERLGATLALQFQPFEGTLLSFDALYADLKGTREETYLEAPSFSTSSACTASNLAGACGIADTNVVSSTISNGVMVKGVFDDVDLAVENRFDKLQTKFTQLSLTGEHKISDAFTIHGFVGHSKSDHQNPIQTTLRFDYFNVDGYSYDYTDSRNPTFGYGNAALTDASKWKLTQIRLRPQTAVNTYDTAQAWGEYRLNDSWSINAGVNYKQYSFDTTELRRSVGTSTNQETVIPTSIAAMALSGFSTLASFDGVQTVIPSIAKAVSALSLYDPTAYGGAFKLGAEPALGNNRGVTEEDTGGHVQADFRTELGGWGVRGNFGARYVRTKQYARGYTYVGGSPVGITAGREYTDTLPAMNLVLEPRDNFLVRFGAAKVMSRPDLGNLTPGSTVSVSGTARTVNAGNPNLDPFRATTYDLAFEWYFQSQALLSVAFFQKDIDSLVQTLSTASSFTGNAFGLPDSVAIAACGATTGCNPAAQWIFSTPINTPGGSVKGVELNYQQPFKFLPGPLANTGVLLNYTYVKSDITYYGQTSTTKDGVTTYTTVPVSNDDLTGLSRNGYNATLYYEDAKFSARVSASYRDKYLTRVLGQENTTAAPVAYDGTNETLNIDASLQYTINDQFKITLEGVNLTDEYQDQFSGTQDMPVVYHHTGREILLGLRYKF